MPVSSLPRTIVFLKGDDSGYFRAFERTKEFTGPDAYDPSDLSITDNAHRIAYLEHPMLLKSS